MGEIDKGRLNQELDQVVEIAYRAEQHHESQE